MCGIAGFASADDDSLIAGRLGAGIANRGPDGTSIGTFGGWCLVQTRLAIIDLSDRVVYPMTSEDGEVALAFNGEIYNHDVLRAELERRGHRFANRCDAEVIVHGWEEWGEDLFARLSGMFAIALADTRTGELILARDRLGIKPLVYTTGERLAFASDAFALVSAGLSPGDIDEEAVGEFAAFHYVPHPRTGVRDIRQLEPGCLLRSRSASESTIRRWAPMPFSGPRTGAPPTADELEDALVAATERHLVADVEVGILLSGGADSRLLLALAVGLGAHPQAFTMTFAGHGDYDESPTARATAQALGVSYRETRLELDFDAVLDQVADAYDQPFADASAIATLAVARSAREHVKVVLSGTGGDDLFAGYPRHRAYRLHRMLSALPTPARRGLIALRGARGGERSSLASTLRSYGARLGDAAQGGDAEEQYLRLAADHSSPAATMLLDAEPDTARDAVAARLGLRAVQPGSILRELQAFELRTYLPGDLLTKEDRATMAVGLEGRVPLLDLDVLAIAERSRDAQRATLRAGKVLLREVAQRHLAGLPAQQRKRGFAVPLNDLLRTRWRAPAIARLRESDTTTYSSTAAAQLLEDGGLPATDAWALSVLAAWDDRLSRLRRQSRVGT